MKRLATERRCGCAGRWLVIAFSALLAACSLVPAPPASPVVYDLGPAAATGADSSANARLPAALHVQAPPWLDGPALVYRLDYADAARLASYRDSRWAAAPAVLLHERLRQRMVQASGPPQATLLRVEIEEFCQRFAAPTRSRAVLRLRATLLDSASGRALRQRAFAAEVEAASADAAGGAHALARAADQLAGPLLAWAAAAP